jgi:hypothetical protein
MVHNKKQRNLKDLSNTEYMLFEVVNAYWFISDELNFIRRNT